MSLLEIHLVQTRSMKIHKNGILDKAYRVTIQFNFTLCLSIEHYSTEMSLDSKEICLDRTTISRWYKKF